MSRGTKDVIDLVNETRNAIQSRLPGEVGIINPLLINRFFINGKFTKIEGVE